MREAGSPERKKRAAAKAINEAGVEMLAVATAGGIKKRAARLLGISFRSFRYRLEKLEVGGAKLED